MNEQKVILCQGLENSLTQAISQCPHDKLFVLTDEHTSRLCLPKLKEIPFLQTAEEISIGDFVLSGGEPAALTMLDAVIRYIPHVLGNADSLAEESFANGLLEYPQYTRPQVWNGLSVPDVLVSGHHKNIENWRKEQSIQLTKERRPDLWKAYEASQPKKG